MRSNTAETRPLHTRSMRGNVSSVYIYIINIYWNMAWRISVRHNTTMSYYHWERDDRWRIFIFFLSFFWKDNRLIQKKHTWAPHFLPFFTPIFFFNSAAFSVLAHGVHFIFIFLSVHRDYRINLLYNALLYMYVCVCGLSSFSPLYYMSRGGYERASVRKLLKNRQPIFLTQFFFPIHTSTHT